MKVLCFVAKNRSNWWYLLPIVLSIIGGLVGYFILKKDDPTKAKNILIIGIVMFVISIALKTLGYIF